MDNFSVLPRHIHTKDISLGRSVCEDYFRCDLDTFLGQPDSDFSYTGKLSTVVESFKVENLYRLYAILIQFPIVNL